MTTTYLLAADALMPTPDGPAIARHLSPGTGLMVIDRQGRVAESAVACLKDLGMRPMVRLLTDAGELTLNERSVITTRRGRLFAIDVARHVRQGTPARVEMARGADLPAGKPPADDRAAVRATIACLDPPVIRVPRALNLGAGVEHLLERADIQFNDVSDDRWTAFIYDRCSLRHDAVPPSITDLSLLTLTAWAQDGATMVSRTTLDQSKPRRRLLAALACAGTPGEVRWLPGYRPVEARVSPGDPRPYAVAKAAFFEAMPAVGVQLSSEVSIISDLAIVAPAACNGA